MNTTNETAPRMIGLKEYAERHGYSRYTVAYWCQKGLLKGVVKIPDAKSGYAKYIYLIPEDAPRPQKKTAESIAAEHGMLSAREYAAKTGCNEKTVQYWCTRGKLPGAVKNMLDNGHYVWLIPEGAETEKPYRPRTPAQKPETEEMAKTPKPVPQRTEREISLYIRRWCGTKTYRAMAQDLGMSTLEIRARYDRLHERYGI